MEKKKDLKDKDNGKGELDRQTLAELKELQELLHSPDSTDKAFKSQEVFNAIKMLVLPDDELMENSMRLFLQSNRLILAIAGYYHLCEEHGYESGKKWVRLLCALLTSRKGLRVEQFVDSIIGERKWKEAHGPGLMERAKNWLFNKPQT